MSEHTQPREFTLRRLAPVRMSGRETRVEGVMTDGEVVHTVEIGPMLDMIERLMSPLFGVREDAEVEAITLLRAHGRPGAPVASPDEARWA